MPTVQALKHNFLKGSQIAVRASAPIGAMLLGATYMNLDFCEITSTQERGVQVHGTWYSGGSCGSMPGVQAALQPAQNSFF